MPYQQGQRLPGERASRLGHLDVLNSDLVTQLCASFESTGTASPNTVFEGVDIPTGGKLLPFIFAVDGSLQPIESDFPPYKALAFVKTALLKLDPVALSGIDKESPNPFALRDILKDAALYHATVFPLRFVSVPGMSIYNAVRHIIFDSIKDASLEGQPMEALKWLMYEKWDGVTRSLKEFQCPHCEKDVATLPYDAEKGKCPGCDGDLLITDVLGFHQEMAEDSAPDIIASNYMLVHETLLLFAGIRFYWETNRNLLSQCLWVKDGPLAIRAQYSKMVAPIRRFLSHARQCGYPVNIVGQEKTGYFVDYLNLVGDSMPAGSLFIPGNDFIKGEIQHRPQKGYPYGIDTNYGAKVLVRLNNYHKMVLTIPTGEYKSDPCLSDLIGADRIFPTLLTILSHQYEDALLPIQLANGVASLSTYPSAQILKMFADEKIK